MIKNQRNLSEPVRFITDHNLGRLAKWLRLLGYDTLCHEGKTNQELWNRALKDQRIVVKKKKTLQYFPNEIETIILGAEDLEGQLAELFEKLSIKPQEAVFLNICAICNSRLKQADRRQIADFVPTYIQEHNDHFSLCPVCSKIYWRGSHVEHIKKILRMHNLMDHP
jgi:hypothetical protein